MAYRIMLRHLTYSLRSLSYYMSGLSDPQRRVAKLPSSICWLWFASPLTWHALYRHNSWQVRRNRWTSPWMVRQHRVRCSQWTEGSTWTPGLQLTDPMLRTDRCVRRLTIPPVDQTGWWWTSVISFQSLSSFWLADRIVAVSWIAQTKYTRVCRLSTIWICSSLKISSRISTSLAEFSR